MMMQPDLNSQYLQLDYFQTPDYLLEVNIMDLVTEDFLSHYLEVLLLLWKVFKYFNDNL